MPVSHPLRIDLLAQTAEQLACPSRFGHSRPARTELLATTAWRIPPDIKYAGPLMARRPIRSRDAAVSRTSATTWTPHAAHIDGSRHAVAAFHQAWPKSQPVPGTKLIVHFAPVRDPSPSHPGHHPATRSTGCIEPSEPGYWPTFAARWGASTQATSLKRFSCAQRPARSLANYAIRAGSCAVSPRTW